MKVPSGRPAKNPNRGASYSTLLRVAGPVLLGSLTQSVIYLTESLFVGRLGEVSLAAIGMGGLLFYLLTTVGAGLGLALQVVVARRMAQSRPGAARRQFVAAGHLALLLSVGLAVVLWLLAPELSAALLPTPAAAAEVARYLQVVTLAVPASFGWLWLVGLYTGLGQTRLIPWSALGIAFANILGSYAWIGGGFGAPRLGIAGAAWATVLSESVGFAVLLVGLLWPAQAALAGWLRKWRWHRRATRRLLRFAGPVVLQQVVEVSSWLTFFVLVGQLGIRALALSNIARSLYTFASLPALALAAALQTLVSRYVGQGRQADVLPTVRRATMLAALLGLGPVLALLAVPAQLAGWFSDEPALVAASVPLLRLLAGLLLAFSAGTMLSNAVVGVGGSDRALGMELGATTTYLLAAWSTVHLGLPLAAVWATEFAYWNLLGVLGWRYLRRGQWQPLQ